MLARQRAVSRPRRCQVRLLSEEPISSLIGGRIAAERAWRLPVCVGSGPQRSDAWTRPPPVAARRPPDRPAASPPCPASGYIASEIQTQAVTRHRRPRDKTVRFTRLAPPP